MRALKRALCQAARRTPNVHREPTAAVQEAWRSRGLSSCAFMSSCAFKSESWNLKKAKPTHQPIRLCTGLGWSLAESDLIGQENRS